MAKQSFWQRGEDYAKKVSGELIEQIKAGVAPWQKPLEAGGAGHPGEFFDRQEVQRGQQPVSDEPGDPRGAGR